MRYSSDEPTKTHQPVEPSEDNRAFFEKLGATQASSSFAGAILLIGAVDHRALAVRRAQAALRYDRRPSEWSHAALLLAWPGKVDTAVGLEVALDSDVPHAPERNGVTPFKLSRYFDTKRYPNVAVVIPSFTGDAAKRGGAKAITEAALHPNRERERFPFYEGLSPWAHFTYAPESVPNPLLSNVPLPGAAFCEYAYAAAGVDLTPGATSNSTCPELLWATIRRWAKRLKEVQGTALTAFTLRRDPNGTPLESAPPLAEDPVISGALTKSRSGAAGKKLRAVGKARKRRKPRGK